MAIISSVFSVHRKRHSIKKAVSYLAMLLAMALIISLPARADEREIVLRTKPAYPELAKRLKIAGSVLLNVVVKPNGTVKTVSVVMGNSALAEAAKEAVYRWKFASSEFETTEQVEVEFHLPN